LTNDLFKVGQCASAGEISHLVVAVSGDLEREVGALALGQRGQDAQRLARGDGVVERPRVGDRVVPIAVLATEAFEAGVATIDRRQA